MGRLLRTKSLQGVNSLSFLSFLDSLPLGEFLNHVDFCKGLWVAGQVAPFWPPDTEFPTPHPGLETPSASHGSAVVSVL